MVYGVNDMASAVPAYIVPRRDPRTQSEGVVEGYAQPALRWPAQPLARRAHGPSELTRPRLAPRLKASGANLAGQGGAPGGGGGRTQAGGGGAAHRSHHA